MLPSLCMDITDSDQSGVAWHRLAMPRKPEAYIRPFHVSERPRQAGGGKPKLAVFISKFKGPGGIDTQCAGADTGRLRTERWDEKRAGMLRHHRASRPDSISRWGERASRAAARLADETCLNQQNSEAPESFSR